MKTCAFCKKPIRGNPLASYNPLDLFGDGPLRPYKWEHVECALPKKKLKKKRGKK